MAEAFVVGQIFEALCGELVKAIREVWTKSKEFKPLLQQLESTVDRITPIFKEIESLNQAVHRPKTETAVFGEQLHEAKNLVLKCDGARWWNKSSYAKKLIEYDRSLTRFFQIDVTAQILHSVRRVEKDLAGEKKKEGGGDKKAGEPTYWGDRPWPLPGSIPTRPPPPAPAPPPPPPAILEPAMDIGEHPLDFLRNSPQFLALRPLLQRNPRLLELTLQGLREKHPDILQLIKDQKAEFLKLIYGPVDDDDISKLIEDHKDLFEELTNEPVDGSDGDLSDQPEQETPPAISVSHAEQEMPHTISVILAEQEAIERLEEMGFDSNLVIEAFLACDGNEELAVKYLLENAGYFED